MLGYTLLRRLTSSSQFAVHGTIRAGASDVQRVPGAVIHQGVDVHCLPQLLSVLERVRPAQVINCIGLIKQRAAADDPSEAISVNSLFPHQLAAWCACNSARMIHFSTDCVFAGDKGGYKECDVADADDLYGRSKRLGEVDYDGHLTLRTSLIGHELSGRLSLIDWFLGTSGTVTGYGNVVFSGLPTVEIARVLAEFILPDESIRGLYHLSAEPIDKDRLLRLVAAKYGHRVTIQRSEVPRLDRSLDSERLRARLSYRPAPWEQLVATMYDDYRAYYEPLRANATVAS
jgi:dTDP-4-dehydrorhamnose reductase